ncbi:kinase-like protein [Panus rudis PR-1116 ss-1]|nr:kinase-like protein [Panus rudis PR-1116 ss-1]
MYSTNRCSPFVLGRVYFARIISSSSGITGRVVVKKANVTKHVRYPALQHEACAYLLLNGHPTTPEVYAWGRSNHAEYLVMEELGIDAVEHVHKHGIIHCDIKPGNFVFTLDRKRITLIDFGFARPWRDLATGAHVAERTIPHLIGTRYYASINVHYHHCPSRRDDFESLAYTITELLRGELPWEDKENTQILQTKVSWTGETLCVGYPAYHDEPAYEVCRSALRALRLIPGPGPDDLHEAASQANKEDTFAPTSEWPDPHIVHEDELLVENEEEWVRLSFLERIEQPPKMNEPWRLRKLWLCQSLWRGRGDRAYRRIVLVLGHYHIFIPW